MIQRIDSLFLLHTKHSTYCFRVTEQGFLQHLHYGCRLDVSGGWQGLIPQMRHIPANAAALDGLALEDTDLEISAPSMGDLRECFLTVRAANGDTLTDFRFEGADVLVEAGGVASVIRARGLRQKMPRANLGGTAELCFAPETWGGAFLYPKRTW